MNFNNIKKVAKQKKINLSEIAARIGMTQEGFSRSLSDENLKVTTLEKIAEILEIDVREFFDENELIEGIEVKKTAIQNLVHTKMQDVPSETVIQIPIAGRASAGYIVGYGQDNERMYLKMCGLPVYREEVNRAFMIDGNSMFPLFLKDDVAYCVRIIDIDNYNFKPDYAYVIVSHDGITLKHIKKQSDGLLAIPRNNAYQSYKIPFNEIFEIWHAIKRIHDV